jgi:HD-GYP domain-containing protein (c-di-GMP phosphodiesterase class II)
LTKLEIGAPLHDIGKLLVPEHILKTERKLTTEEFAEMKQHTTRGDVIVSSIADLHPIRPIVRSHHERWDGAGYPDGLAGEAIPLMARIVSIVDAYDAMTTTRPYRNALSVDVAFAEIERMSGKQFDPQCAAAFLAIREKVADAMKTENETAVVVAARAKSA